MLTPDGFEVPDPKPVEMPTRLKLPQSRADQIRAFVRQEMSEQMHAQGFESFEEADDFDLPEGEDWASPYEVDFDPPPAGLSQADPSPMAEPSSPAVPPGGNSQGGPQAAGAASAPTP